MANDAPAGAPMWMVTFADLMALLLTLFVLMLTFSEMNVTKYKAMAGSMRSAFGISKSDKLSGMIEMDGAIRRKAAANVDISRRPTQETSLDLEQASDEDVKAEAEVRTEKQMAQLAGAMKEAIADEITGSGIAVEHSGGEVVIRFPSEIAFGSGSSGVSESFAHTLAKLAPMLAKTKGQIVVAGHTDNVPLRGGGRFTSNWDLSAARATAVVHEFLRDSGIDPGRVTVQGFGDSRPLQPNDTPEGRAKNRRVEVSILAPRETPGSGPAAPNPRNGGQ